MALALPDRAYVWVWLPGAVTAVVAGVVLRSRDVLDFQYGESYLAKSEAIPLFGLPLGPDWQRPEPLHEVAGCLRDALPDAWGQRVIAARLAAAGSEMADGDLLTYMLNSGSDRVGALDFQADPFKHRARGESADLGVLDDLAAFAEGKAVSEELATALEHGTSIGGARPKALLVDGSGAGPARPVVAKFSVSSDPFPVVKAEAVAMNLAARVGLNVAGTRVMPFHGRDVLLVDRFDRPGTAGSASGPVGSRRLMVSALTVLGSPETEARFATYPMLADAVRGDFVNPTETLRELFSRIVFNILVSNTDDHLRNHSAFWDGERLELTPAYDISPQSRTGDSAALALGITRSRNRAARLAVAVAGSWDGFNIELADAQAIVDAQVSVVRDQWKDAADECRLTDADRQLMWERLILNPAVFHEDGEFDTFGPFPPSGPGVVPSSAR